jgi:hypothetical protein
VIEGHGAERFHSDFGDGAAYGACNPMLANLIRRLTQLFVPVPEQRSSLRVRISQPT